MAKARGKAGVLAPILPEFTLGGVIDKDDVVAISVAAYEGKLLQDEKDLRSMLDDLSKQITTTNEAMAKEAESVVDKRQKDTSLKAVCAALKKAGFGDYIPATSLAEIREEKNTSKIIFMIHVGFAQKDTRGRNQNRNRHGYHSDLTFVDEIPQTVIYKDLNKKYIDLKRQHRDTEDEILEVQKNLSNLEKKEREAKAQLAVIALETTPEGRALLSRMGVIPTKRLTGKR